MIKYTKSLADTVIAVREAGADASVQAEILNEVSELLAEAKKANEKLALLDAKAADMEEGREKALYYHDVVTPAMAALRSPIDKLEMIVDKEAWPMPSYGDLMFEV